MLVVDTQATDISVPHEFGRSCQHSSIQSCSRILFGGCPGAVCLRSASFRSFAFVLPSLISLKLGLLVVYWNPRCCTLWPLGEGVLVVIVTARTSSSLSEVVYCVYDCFVDRHNKKIAPPKKQKHGDWTSRRAIQAILKKPCMMVGLLRQPGAGFYLISTKYVVLCDRPDPFWFWHCPYPKSETFTSMAEGDNPSTTNCTLTIRIMTWNSVFSYLVRYFGTWEGTSDDKNDNYTAVSVTARLWEDAYLVCKLPWKESWGGFYSDRSGRKR